MKQRYLCLTGFVLAGGASRRMGCDKAQLPLGRETMLARQIRLLNCVCRSVAVLGPAWNFDHPTLTIFPDELPGRGPLGGIYTGLHQSHTEFNLILGCDLPFVPARFLRFLVGEAIKSQADATVPETRSHGIQPLCAVYRRRALSPIRSSLNLGVNRIRGFFRDVHCRIIPWRDTAAAGFLPRIFDNINTRDDYERAKRMLSPER